TCNFHPVAARLNLSWGCVRRSPLPERAVHPDGCYPPRSGRKPSPNAVGAKLNRVTRPAPDPKAAIVFEGGNLGVGYSDGGPIRSRIEQTQTRIRVASPDPKRAITANSRGAVPAGRGSPPQISSNPH